MENVFEIKKTGVDINTFIVDTINNQASSTLGVNILEAAKNYIKSASIIVDNIPENSIPASKLATGSIGTSELQNGVVVTEKIKDEAVTPEKLSKSYIHLNGISSSPNPPSSLPSGEIYIIYEN